MKFDPASEIQDLLMFGEFGDVNPSITDSSTYTFLNPATMQEIFSHEIEGCFLYSRHWNPINKYLCHALAAMESTEAAQVTASGMSAISSAILQLCNTGDEVIASWTIYGGTYAFLKNFLPKFGIQTHFIDLSNLDELKRVLNKRTKVIYTESISNPLLEVADIPRLSRFANEHGLALVIDNTFSPMIISPARWGAHVVVHSMTKFINGTSDCVAGCICSSQKFVEQLTDINAGATMLLGPVLDSLRAASILKNLHSLHIRMQKHSANALLLAGRLHELSLKVHYPGLPSHKNHELMKQLMNPGLGFGGMLAIDLGDETKANALMTKMQEEKVGYLAVSLGYFKTLFSAPSSSTSSEIPEDLQKQMGLSRGMIRLSVGIDNDMERSVARTEKCLKEVGLV
jgi:methionine-gamma-lyase